MTLKSADVRLHGVSIGGLKIDANHSTFAFNQTYIDALDRNVLGLAFEDDLFASHTSNVFLPPWFSNLLPEGNLRKLIAQDCGVSAKREFELLLHVGRDLSGAVTVVPTEGDQLTLTTKRTRQFDQLSSDAKPWTFSLAGVALKFSMIRESDRFTIPARDEKGGDWIIKLPDLKHLSVPENEFSIMQLASLVGIDVPEIELVHRDRIQDVPGDFWPSGTTQAYAVRRFDRADDRNPIHIEDFAQIHSKWPHDKYLSDFNIVANICYRGRDEYSLLEFVRRLTFNVLVGNGDAHLKNWSMIYADRKTPRLSPAYDLVATTDYIAREDLGMKWFGKKRFVRFELASFGRLAAAMGASQSALQDCARETVARVVLGWPQIVDRQILPPELVLSIGQHIRDQSNRLLSRTA